MEIGKHTVAANKPKHTVAANKPNNTVRNHCCFFAAGEPISLHKAVYFHGTDILASQETAL